MINALVRAFPPHLASENLNLNIVCALLGTCVYVVCIVKCFYAAFLAWSILKLFLFSF